MKTRDEFIEVMYRKDDTYVNSFTPFVRHISVSYNFYKRINFLEQKNKELENRLIKLEDFIVEKLHDKGNT